MLELFGNFISMHTRVYRCVHTCILILYDRLQPFAGPREWWSGENFGSE